MPTTQKQTLRGIVSTIIALGALVLVQSTNAANIDCGTWTANVKSGNYDTGDTFWWNSSVTFTNR